MLGQDEQRFVTLTDISILDLAIKGNMKSFHHFRQRINQMKRAILIVILLSLEVSLILAQTSRSTNRNGRDAPAVEQFETRCGWFSNPTPANASLYDRAGEWIIGVQGGYQAEGDWPAFGPRQWVKTNVNYGYGCACLRLRVNRETHEVIEIESSRARPLAACRRDRSLRRWGFR